MNKLFGPRIQPPKNSSTEQQNSIQQTPPPIKKPISFNNLFGHLLKTEEKKSETTASEHTNSVNSDKGLFQTNNQKQTEQTEESEKPFRLVHAMHPKYIKMYHEQLANKAQDIGKEIDDKLTELNTALSSGNLESIEKSSKELQGLEKEVTTLLNDLSESATQNPSLKKTVSYQKN